MFHPTRANWALLSVWTEDCRLSGGAGEWGRDLGLRVCERALHLRFGDFPSQDHAQAVHECLSEVPKLG